MMCKWDKNKETSAACMNQHTYFIYLFTITGIKVFISVQYIIIAEYWSPLGSVISILTGFLLRHAVLLNLFLSSVAAMITLSQMMQHFLTVGFQQWISATVVDMKSPSFVCLTSEVRALFVASCFEVFFSTVWTMLFLLPLGQFVWDCPQPNYLAWSLGKWTVFGALLIIFI